MDALSTIFFAFVPCFPRFSHFRLPYPGMFIFHFVRLCCSHLLLSASTFYAFFQFCAICLPASSRNSVHFLVFLEYFFVVRYLGCRFCCALVLGRLALDLPIQHVGRIARTDSFRVVMRRRYSSPFQELRTFCCVPTVGCLGVVLSTMHGRSRMSIDPRILTMPGRSASGF